MTRKVYLLIGSILFLALSAALFTVFLEGHEVVSREQGWEFDDVIMNLFPSHDVSVYIFTITYGAIPLYILLARKRESFVAKGFLAYALLLWFRMICLWLVPLKAPDDMVFLNDPFLNNLVYPGEITSDLFFSGHTGLLFIFFFLSKRWVFVILGIVLGSLLMIQRTHYSIDILAAVPFAYVIVRIVEFITSRYLKPAK